MWAVYASLASIAIGLYYLGNQAAKVSSTVFMVYRGVMPILFLLPVLPFVSLPAAWPFYVVCLVQGGVISFVDMRNFRAMRVWGAETISSIHPFCVGIVFFVWLLLNPGGLIAYGREPLRFLTVAAALGTVIFSVSSYRGDRRGRKALRYMVPYLLFCAACDTLNKTAMSFLRPHELVSGSCLLYPDHRGCHLHRQFFFLLPRRRKVKGALGTPERKVRVGNGSVGFVHGL